VETYPMTFNLPQSDRAWEPHPEGKHTGAIAAVKPGKPRSYQGGPERPTIMIQIETDNCPMEDGRPFLAVVFCTLSSHPQSNLTAIREAILGRSLQGEETLTFNSEDYIGQPVRYIIEHLPSNRPEDPPGTLKSFVKKGSLRHMNPDYEAPYPVRGAAAPVAPAPVAAAVPAQPRDQGTPPPGDEDLPF